MAINIPKKYPTLPGGNWSNQASSKSVILDKQIWNVGDVREKEQPITRHLLCIEVSHAPVLGTSIGTREFFLDVTDVATRNIKPRAKFHGEEESFINAVVDILHSDRRSRIFLRGSVTSKLLTGDLNVLVTVRMEKVSDVISSLSADVEMRLSHLSIFNPERHLWRSGVFALGAKSRTTDTSNRRSVRDALKWLGLPWDYRLALTDDMRIVGEDPDSPTGFEQERGVWPIYAIQLPSGVTTQQLVDMVYEAQAAVDFGSREVLMGAIFGALASGIAAANEYEPKLADRIRKALAIHDRVISESNET